MNPNRKPLELMVAQGWILMFLVFVCINLIEFLNASMRGTLQFFATTEGAVALRVIVVLMLLHAFVPMLVMHFESRKFRWGVAILTMTFGVLMFIHEIIHLFLVKDRSFGFFDALDFAHHGLAIWVSVIAVRWARVAPRPHEQGLEASRAVAPEVCRA